MASLQPSNAHDGNPHISPGKSKADSQEACVEPTDVMRKEHYRSEEHTSELQSQD